MEQEVAFIGFIAVFFFSSGCYFGMQVNLNFAEVLSLMK